MVPPQTVMAIHLLLLLDSMTMVHLQTAMVIPQLQPLDPHQLTVTELLLLPVAELCLGKNVTPSKTKFPDRNAAPFQGKSNSVPRQECQSVPSQQCNQVPS